MTAVPTGPTYVYNAEGELTSTSAGVSYKYDGDGKRVSKSNGKLYWYGGVSDPIAETDASGNTTDEYIFFGSKRVARSDASGNVVYYVADHLGTSRMVTNSTGGILDQSDFYSFGGERVITASSGNTYKFTGKERDAESNLDNLGARYNAYAFGRFMSPDPVFINALRVMDPQRLNLYAYGCNNPLAFHDPTGKDIVSGTGDQKAIKSALVEIARHPGGREFLTKLDKLTQKITLNTGTGIKYPDGSPAPGHNVFVSATPGADPHLFDRTRDSTGRVVDVKAPNSEVTIDPALSKQMRETGDPNAPHSDGELLGHELKEVEHTDFKTNSTEEQTNLEIDSILNSPTDMNSKDAGQFVNDLLKPNSDNQPEQPTSPVVKPKGLFTPQIY
jgi:RHS repeat-associated protein